MFGAIGACPERGPAPAALLPNLHAPAGGAVIGTEGKGSAAARMPRRCDIGGRLGYLCRRDVFCSPILAESHFLLPQG